MSEQIERFNLCDGSGAVVVYADDYDALLVKVELLRKDAERYRWLTSQATTDASGGNSWDFPWIDAWDYKPGSTLNEQFADVHTAIDAAMIGSEL